jgi:hypothetical protein
LSKFFFFPTKSEKQPTVQKNNSVFKKWVKNRIFKANRGIRCVSRAEMSIISRFIWVNLHFWLKKGKITKSV